MPSSKGLRSKTRDLFQRPFRGRGPVHLSTYLTSIKLGDYVDVKGNGAIHKGLPHKYYHGRTGIVWNITPRAVGVEINKQVRNRIIKKRIHVRVEHVQKSRSREGFITRVKENERLRLEAKKAKKKITLKRSPALPRPGQFVTTKKTEIETLHPVPFTELF